MKSSFDKTVYSLCEEIDELKESVLYWKERYENEVSERNKEWKERSEQVKKDLGTALLFALSTTDDENGNLIIKKEDRSALADRFKKEDLVEQQ
jgi:hypothetical protein